MTLSLTSRMLPIPRSGSMILAILLFSCLIPQISALQIVQFTYQSQSLDITEWISLLTLCLAPVIAHIIAGVPTPIYLSPKHPAWHNLIGHFNLTSILWRYYIIADRRARAKTWTAIDMAANCALFWTSNGWDGSEEMIFKSRAFCTRVPSHRRITFFSISAAETVILTIQGIQSISLPLLGLSNGNFVFSVSLGFLFNGVAFLGLMRLPAALWLTTDASYMDSENAESVSEGGLASVEMGALIKKSETVSTVRLRDLDEGGQVSIQEMFYPPNTWRSIMIRMAFLLPLLGAVALTMVSTWKPQHLQGPTLEYLFTATGLLVAVFYPALIAGLVIILSVYFWTGNTNSTVLPCLERTWYKIYTIILIFLMVAAIIVSGFETRRSKCGIYTTTRPNIDQMGCAEK